MNAPTEDYQVFKRPMTEADGRGADKAYKSAQKQARPAGIFALVFALIGFVNGANTLDISTSNGLMSIMIIVVGLFAFGMAFFTFRMRKDLTSAYSENSAIVIRGRVSRFSGRANTNSMVVGPVAVGWNSRSPNPLQEGAFAEIGIIPKLRSVVSINGNALDRPIKIVVPADLEARASASMPPAGRPAYPANQGPAATPDPTGYCFSCGKPANGLTYCYNCGTKLK